MSVFSQDLRFALRVFRKNLGFTTVAAITLALGIGTTTAIFSIVNGVRLSPVPFHDSEDLLHTAYPKLLLAQCREVSWDRFFEALGALEKACESCDQQRIQYLVEELLKTLHALPKAAENPTQCNTAVG